jgi:hypothetical protein
LNVYLSLAAVVERVEVTLPTVKAVVEVDKL